MKEQTSRWVLKAEKDLKTAEILLKSKENVSESVCFHSQQCVEKMLKAFLVEKDAAFRKTHDIGELMMLCRKIDESFSEIDMENITGMTFFATEMRYPDADAEPSFEIASESLKAAKDVLEFVKKRI